MLAYNFNIEIEKEETVSLDVVHLFRGKYERDKATLVGIDNLGIGEGPRFKW